VAVIHVLLYKMELCFFSLRLHIHIQTFFFIWIFVTVVLSSKAIPSVIEKYPYKKGDISWGVLSQWEVPSLEGYYLSERCHLLRGATSVRGAISWGVLPQWEVPSLEGYYLSEGCHLLRGTTSVHQKSDLNKESGLWWEGP
jgi:hypothetical protein